MVAVINHLFGHASHPISLALRARNHQNRVHAIALYLLFQKR